MELVKDLTPQEQALADVLEKYYNKFAKGRINETSNLAYGFDRAMGEHYAPIRTNQNYNASAPGVYDITAEGVGSMKERQHGTNPSYNMGAFDAFEKHVDQTSRWCGLTVPIRDFNAVLNSRSKDTSLKDVLSHKWGADSVKLVEGLLTDLNGGKAELKKTFFERAADTALSRYITSVFGFNPGIILKQAMSAPLAGTYLGWKNVPNVAAALKTSDKLINTYTSELAYRLLGYATPETAALKNNPSKLSQNKALQNVFGGGGITAMDGATVKTIWRWAENAVRKDSQGLEMGSQEQIDAGYSPFYQEVARRFEEAVSNSQPMYDVMHRSAAMRSEGAVARTLTLFKTVPQQQLNMLRQTVGEAQSAYCDIQAKKEKLDKALREGKIKQAEYDEAAKKIDRDAYVQARRKAGRAVGGVILAGLGIEAVNFLAALVKNGGKRYRDEDGELTFASAGLEFLKGFIGDNLGMIAGGDLVYDIFGSLVTGDKWYGFETPGVTQIEDVIEEILNGSKQIQKIVQDGFDVVKNGGDLGAYLKRNQGDYIGALESAAETAAAYIGGIPAGNMRAWLLGAVSAVFPEAKTKWEDWVATADKTGLKGLTGDALEVRMGDILKNRLGSADEGTVAVLCELYAAGHTGAAPTDTPSSVIVNGETRQLSAGQKQLYDAVWKDVVGSRLDELVRSDAYTGSDEKGREALVRKLYKYGQERAKAELFDDYEGFSSFEKFLNAGVEQDAALDAALAVDALEPLDGHKSVTDSQKALAVAELGLDRKTTDAAVDVFLEDNAFGKYETAVAAGIDPVLYLNFIIQLDALTADKDENGGTVSGSKKAKVAEAIDELELSDKKKDVLFGTQYSSGAEDVPWR